MYHLSRQLSEFVSLPLTHLLATLTARSNGLSTLYISSNTVCYIRTHTHTHTHIYSDIYTIHCWTTTSTRAMSQQALLGNGFVRTQQYRSHLLATYASYNRVTVGRCFLRGQRRHVLGGNKYGILSFHLVREGAFIRKKM
jgi:hypothetical protein